jgi:transposase
MNGYNDLALREKRELAKGTIEIVGSFFYEFCIPGTWSLLDIERKENEFVFYWISHSEEAVCSNCGTISHSRSNMYFTRPIQDLPISGMTVFHKVRGNRFFCDNTKCNVKNFYEQFTEIAEKDAMMFDRLKDFIIRVAIESSANASSVALKQIGIIAGVDTILRLIKKKGAAVVEQNLQRDDVKVLSVDDVNLRKGNSSTACSVFIDAETHRVLVIAQSATCAVAQKVIKQFPTSSILSRDRGSAYSSAGKKEGKEQVADRFHLIQNIHQTIKDILSTEMPYDIFIRSGDGWARMVNSSNEDITPETTGNTEEIGIVACVADTEPLVVISPANEEDGDIEIRSRLAGLNAQQADKYKKTRTIIEMAESGLRTGEIAKKLSISNLDVISFRRDAVETINKVEDKIDEYYKMQADKQWEYHQKTIVKNARPSSESIVAPFKEVVVDLFLKGGNHRSIHPIITEQGFSGSENAIYQFIIKYCHENNISYGPSARVIPHDDRNKDITLTPRPLKISIERMCRKTVYEYILKAASLQSKDAQDTDKEKSENISTKSGGLGNKSKYSDKVAKIVFDAERQKNDVTKKKITEQIFVEIKDKYRIIPEITSFLNSFKEIIQAKDINSLDRFIDNYENNPIDGISTFVSGIKKDYSAVKNALVYKYISNGPMEGSNSKIKMIRRRSFGRAGIELLNALTVIPWCYRDIKESSGNLQKLVV